MPSRTAEFKACVESVRLRTSTPVPEHKQRLLANGANHAKSEFARSAGAIAKDIQATMTKLEKLALLAKRKTLFDDRPVEISELTYIIKRDIATLNQQIAGLQQLIRSQNTAKSKKQVEEHNNNIVVMLQGKLADASMGFKDVLEVRTQNMKASRSRTEQFTYQGNAAAPSGPSSDSPLYAAIKPASSNVPSGRSTPAQQDWKGKGRADGVDADGKTDFLALDMGSSMQSDMQVQALEQGDGYLQSRSTAIESIESTIAEMGQIFSQLASMVQQQGETVQRIDADTTDIADNISGAQRELLKYYASVSGNRMLMLKVFGILIIFFLLFTLLS